MRHDRKDPPTARRRLQSAEHYRGTAPGAGNERGRRESAQERLREPVPALTGPEGMVVAIPGPRGARATPRPAPGKWTGHPGMGAGTTASRSRSEGPTGLVPGAGPAVSRVEMTKGQPGGLASRDTPGELGTPPALDSLHRLHSAVVLGAEPPVARREGRTVVRGYGRLTIARIDGTQSESRSFDRVAEDSKGNAG